MKHNEEDRVVALIPRTQDSRAEHRTSEKATLARVVARNPGTYRYRWDLCHVGPLGRCLDAQAVSCGSVDKSDVRYDGSIRSSRAPRPAARPKRRTRVSHTVA